MFSMIPYSSRLFDDVDAWITKSKKETDSLNQWIYNEGPSGVVSERLDDGREVFYFDVPGLTKEDLSIELHKNILVVKGSKKLKKQAEKKVNYTLKLSDSVNQSSIEANCENGLLTVVLTQKEEERMKLIEIK